jgi:hypothetical protein
MEIGVFRDLLRDMSRAKVVTTPKAELDEIVDTGVFL